MTLFIFRSPESDIRPEKFIADRIERKAKSLGLKVVNLAIDLTTSRNRKLLGKDFFYGEHAFLSNYLTSCEEFFGHEIVDEDRLLFIDGFYQALPMIDYYLMCTGAKPKKLGIFHSSSQIPSDFFSADRLMMQVEAYCLQSLDTALVATNYLKTKLLQNPFLQEVPNIVKTGLPYNLSNTLRIGRQEHTTVVYNHRWSSEKNHDFFVELIRANQDPLIRFVILTPFKLRDSRLSKLPNLEVVVCKTKDQYFVELNKGDVVFSCARSETFGYAALEGIQSCLVPVFPNSSSYPELVRSEYLYPDSWIYDKEYDKILQFIKNASSMFGKAMKDVLNPELPKIPEENILREILIQEEKQ